MSLIEQKSELQSPQRPVDLKVLANSEHTAPIVISHLETDGCILITAKKSEDFVTFMSRFADSVDEQGYEVRIEDSEVLSSAAANINRPEGNIQPVILVDDASKFLNEEGINTFVKNATILSNKVCPVLYRDEADFTNKIEQWVAAFQRATGQTPTLIEVQVAEQILTRETNKLAAIQKEDIITFRLFLLIVFLLLLQSSSQMKTNQAAANIDSSAQFSAIATPNSTSSDSVNGDQTPPTAQNNPHVTQQLWDQECLLYSTENIETEDPFDAQLHIRRSGVESILDIEIDRGSYALSPDGKRIVYYHRDELGLFTGWYDLETGKQEKRRVSHYENMGHYWMKNIGLTHLTVSPDNETFAAVLYDERTNEDEVPPRTVTVFDGSMFAVPLYRLESGFYIHEMKWKDIKTLVVKMSSDVSDEDSYVYIDIASGAVDMTSEAEFNLVEPSEKRVTGLFSDIDTSYDIFQKAVTCRE